MPVLQELSFLSELKARTADLHRQIESVPLLARLTSGADFTEYRALLLRYWSYYQPFEEKLAALPWFEAGIDFEARRKTEFLEADLDALGFDGERRGRTPRCAALPPCEDLADGLGYLYVLEGSTLGGQFLKRAVSALGPRPVRFFDAYGAQTGAMWSAFRHALTDYVASHGESEAIIEGARTAFLSLQNWLERGHE